MSFRKIQMIHISLIGLLLLVLSLNAPLRAQDTTTTNRDPAALARRLLGFKADFALPPPSPVYKAGDKTQFWVTKQGADKPAQITADLVGVSRNVYLWVEQGIKYDKAKLQQQTGYYELMLAVLRISDNYGSIRNVPQTYSDLDKLDLLTLPDIDNDEHLYILFAAGLADSRPAFYNPNDSLTIEQAPGGFSSQHDLVIVNTSALQGVALDNSAYASLLSRLFFQMVADYNHPNQAQWLRNALASYTILLAQQTAISGNDLNDFFDAPNTSLLQPSETSAAFGAQQLFLRYLIQRFGLPAFSQLFTESGDGFTALESWLDKRNITDLVTGDPITARDVFADFVIANIIDAPVGDGRFVYTGIQLPANKSPAVIPVQDRTNVDVTDLPVNQFGTRYIVVTNTKDVKINVGFNGQPTTQRLPIPGDTSNHFYWSGRTANQDTTLTRAFNLSAVTKATLTFDAWHVLADDWNYAYVEVSTDNGATWKILLPGDKPAPNPNSVAYGPGFNGISSDEPPRPFPYLGVLLDTDGVTILNITPDSPLVKTDVKVGDVIAGYDGKPWEGRISIPAWLGSNYKPGDSVKLFIKRGSKTFDAEVVLGKHPTRVIPPDPVWLKQTIDLTPYASRQILLRFEYISFPDREDYGFAIDNIAIPEINFRDDAESGIPGWTLNGWQQTPNQVQQRFIVQSAEVKQSGASIDVKRLIGPSSKATSGQWGFSVGPNNILLVAVSAVNDDSVYPAQFTLSIRDSQP